MFPITNEDIAPVLVAFFHNAPIKIGPAVAAIIPPIPIHKNTARDSGGFHANITARIITKIVLYLLSINSHLAALSSEILLLGTIVFLNKSFATICDNDTISPSEVDIIAERTATARNAAITGGNNSLNNTGMMESGCISASPPITAIPS